MLLARLLGRDDRPPLSVSIAGDGPVADWHGRLEASSGEFANATADIALALGRDSTLSLTGTAAVAKLLPPELAALTGDSVPVEARATLREDGALAIEALTLGLPAGRLDADALIGRPDREVAAHVAVDLSDLAPASALLGQTVQGSAELSVTVSGTEDRPRVRIEASGGSLRIGGAAAAQGRAQAAVSWSAKPADPAARLLIAADGELRGLALPEGVPRSLGRDLRWSLSASAKPDFSLVELGDFTARGAGIDIAGTGRIAERGDAIDGKMRLVVAELGAFSGIVGHRIGGRLSLDVTAEQQGGDRVLAKIDGSVANLDTGIPAVNALTGRSVAIAGSAERDRGGVFRLDRLAVTGDEFAVGASGRFDPGPAPATNSRAGSMPISAICGAPRRRWACRSPAGSRPRQRSRGRPRTRACRPGSTGASCGPARRRSTSCGSTRKWRTRCSRAPRSTAISAATGWTAALSLTADAGDRERADRSAACS